jgi:hypothetical protein
MYDGLLNMLKLRNLHFPQGQDKTFILPMLWAVIRKSSRGIVKERIMSDEQLLIPKHHFAYVVGDGRCREARSKAFASSRLRWSRTSLIDHRPVFIGLIQVLG